MSNDYIPVGAAREERDGYSIRPVKGNRLCPNCGEYLSIRPSPGWGPVESAVTTYCTECMTKYTLCLIPTEDLDDD